MSVKCLLIMDGYAENSSTYGNAIAMSGAEYVPYLKKTYPYTTLGASGYDVGLPDGQMGNSEVGHLNIGAGRIVYQELTRITKSIKDGDFYENPVFIKAMQHAVENDKPIHLMGLVSDGGVHSHIEHIFALVLMCKKQGVKKCYIHCFMDGRDVPPMSGNDFLMCLDSKLKKLEYGSIASICGRYYAMDRDNRWERVSEAYNAMTAGEGMVFRNFHEAMKYSYDNGITDEFVKPSLIKHSKGEITSIMDNDSIIFFNFRPDRARELSRAFIEKDFNDFIRPTGFLNPCFVSLTQYNKDFTNLEVAYKPQLLKNTFGEYISNLGLKQLRIAETEKYAHVTFFFNGGVEKPNLNEDRVLIPSPKVATYDLKPEMSVYEVTEKCVELIRQEKYDVIIMNFANCDMVGHTGDMEAAIKAVLAVDECVKSVHQAIRDVKGSLLITADHGNADNMYEPNGSPFTAHTTNPVPFILVDDNLKDIKLKKDGKLSDIIPTMLDIMHIEKPLEMSGQTLIVKE